MTQAPTPRSSDALELVEALTGADAELARAIDEARLVLQVAQAAAVLGGLRGGQVDVLDKGQLGTHSVRRLQRIAWQLGLDVRLVLVQRPRDGRRKKG